MRVTVPFLSYERDDGKHCRIPVEEFEKRKRQGLSKEEILEKYADWYAKSSYDMRTKLYAKIAKRDERERIVNTETGLTNEEIVDGYLECFRAAIKRHKERAYMPGTDSTLLRRGERLTIQKEKNTARIKEGSSNPPLSGGREI